MNAIDAMPSRGKLALHVSSRSALGRLTVLVEIRDSGTGIPESLLGRVFDPFVTTKPQGSGLGLSICRGIADAHRATIRIQNNHDGLGAAVVLEFPAATQDVASVDDPWVAPRPARGSFRPSPTASR